MILATMMTSDFILPPRVLAEENTSQVRPANPQADRLERLRNLLGPRAEVSAAGDDIHANVRLHIDRFEQDMLRLFTPIAGQWTLDDGVVRARANGVSQWMCLVPWATDDLEISGRLNASGIAELNLYDPWSPRFTGPDSVGRLHIGRLADIGGEDWFEVSRRDILERGVYRLHFSDGSQDVQLSLKAGRLFGSIDTMDGPRQVEKTVAPGDPPSQVYVGVGGGVLNKVQVDQLDILGRVCLFSSTLTALVGQNKAYWGAGRPVRLYYNAGGTVRRLLINGRDVPETNMTTQPIETQRDLRRADVRLSCGDVLAVELEDADDESAFFLVGVDEQLHRIVVATHPLVWAVAPPDAGDGWFKTAPADDMHPRVGSGGYAEIQAAIREAIGEPMPGLPIAGPQTAHNRVRFKHQIR